MVNSISVKKRNGKVEKLNIEKINKCALRACDGLKDVSASEVVLDAQVSLHEGITTKAIDEALILSARSKIEKEPNYSYVAARIHLNCLYKEVFGESVDEHGFDLQYRKNFITNIKKLVKQGLLDKKLLDFDLKKLSQALVPERDMLFKYIGIKNISDRYLLKLDNKIMETPQAWYMRVAMGLCLNEKHPEDRAIEFYSIYSQFLASPATPTLFNSGTTHSQLSSCFLSEIGDSIDGIFDGLWQEARKSKYAGGLGFHFTKVRAKDANIKGTHGKSSGVVPWLKIYNDMLIAVDQGGKRAGSGCAYLEPWHLDFPEFLDLRKNTGDERRRTHDMNTATWVSDLFFERVQAEGSWTLFCPSETPDLPELFGKEFKKRYEYYEKLASEGKIKNFRVMKAKDLWRDTLKALFSDSHPWITFKDSSNIRYSNIHEGVLHGSNLCCEIFLHTKASEYKDGVKVKAGETAVCNLSSINLPRHVEEGQINYNKLAQTVKTIIRALDNVIDLNFYPTEEAKNSNLKHRPIGLGQMGFSDMCHKLNIIQDTPEGVELADKVTEFISYHAIWSSSDLAKERGTYSTYKGSKWDQGKLPIDTWNDLMKVRGKPHNYSGSLDWDSLYKKIAKDGMRNSNTMAIAPTASISYQQDCNQSIEPDFSVLFVYENKSGNFCLINEYFVEEMKKLNLWTPEMINKVKALDGDLSLIPEVPFNLKKRFCTAFDRNMKTLIEANAARQKWIDMGISFNIYNGFESLKYLNDIYLYAWECGLKSTYYLRNKPASKVEKSTIPTVTSSEPKACSIEAMKRGETCESCQ